MNVHPIEVPSALITEVTLWFQQWNVASLRRSTR